MFYKYTKFSTTKEIRNHKAVECIVISQDIIDSATADLVLNKGVKRIVNCVNIIMNTRYINILQQKGIKICFLKHSAFNTFKNEGFLYYGERCVASGRKCFNTIEPEIRADELSIKNFINNTISYMNKEIELVNDITISELSIKPSNTALIISRGFYDREEVNTAKNIIKKLKPMIICVDGGADSALKMKIKPQLVVGDMDSITQEAIERCDNFLIHKYLDGRCPGEGKIPYLKNIGYISCFGTSEDAAILYCISSGIERIYTLGFKLNTRDYMEKGRKGMASSLLTRLYYGHIIYDIRGFNAGNTSHREKFFAAAAVIIILIYGGIILGLALEVFK